MDSKTLEAEGWVQHKNPKSDTFDGYIGPYWVRNDNGVLTLGLHVDKRHTNGHMGTLHGGIACSFADIGLGCGVVQALGSLARSCVTISLNTQFLSIARVGDFITLEPEVTRQSKQLVFVRGLIKTGDKIVASCEGIWKLLDSAKQEQHKKTPGT